MKYYIAPGVYLFILFTTLSFYSIAEQKPINPYAAIDDMALRIPDSLTHTTSDIARYFSAIFKTDNDKARAAFIWTASTFSYDVDNMYALNFYEKTEDKINKPLATHKGICENYAAVFTDVCNKMGIKAYSITGYTRQHNQNSYVPHAWCTAVINGTWYLFDPTWGSGYVSGKTFIHKIDNSYYKTNPAIRIATHMPFDPMWQLLFYPITSKEFSEGNTLMNTKKPFFAYADSIAVWEKQTEDEQFENEARRIEANGVNSSLIYDRLKHIKLVIEYNKNKEIANKHNENVAIYNAATADYNKAIKFINKFIEYRNKQFKPLVPDAEIQGMVDSADNRIIATREKLAATIANGNITADMLTSLRENVNEVAKHIQEQKQFLAKYFSKGKFMRKTMFTNLYNGQ